MQFKCSTAYSDKKRFVQFVKKGNSETFYEVMKVFYAEAIKEAALDATAKRPIHM